MANDTLRLFLHQLGLAARVARWEAFSDGELLEAYSRQGEEAAFVELMRRHGPMVLGVCRRIAGHSPDAEDAFQATFAVLASRAGALRRAPVGGWLHRVALRTAGKVRRGEARRRTRLREVQARAQLRPNREAGWEEIKPVLDEELGRLPEREHRLLVACYLEGKTHVQAAGEIGLPVGSVARHLGRALERLRRRLARRGVAKAAAPLGVGLAAASAGATVSAELLVHTAATATALAAGSLKAVPARVAALAKAVLSTRTVGRLKLAAVLALGLACAGLGLFTCLARNTRPQDRPPVPGPTAEGGKPSAGGTDRHGDPLPRGALARLGTVRWRHGSLVTVVAFVAGGKQVLTVAQDGSARRWDVGTGREAGHFTLSHRPAERLAGEDRGPMAGFGHVAGVALSADGKVLVSTDAGTIRVWDPAVGKELRQLPPPPEGFTEMALSANGKTLAVLGPGRAIRLYDVAGGKKLRRLGHQSETGGGQEARLALDGSHLAFAPDGKTLVFAAPADEGPNSKVALTVWDTATGKELRAIEDPDGPPCAEAPAFSPDGKLLAWRRWDGTIHLADAATGKKMRRLPGRGQELDHGIGFVFTPDGKTLITRSPSDLSLHVWDVATGKKRRLPGRASGGFLWRNAFGSASEGLALAPDRPLLALASQSHTVRLLDLATGKEVNALGGHACSFAKVSYAPDGKTVASSSEDGTLRIWEAATGKQLWQIELPEQTRCHALSGDCRTLAVALGDNTLTLRDAATGRELHRLPTPKDGIGALAFSPDDRTLAVQGVAGDDISIWLYDVATARERGRTTVQPPAADPRDGLLFPNTAVMGMVFSPDGKTLAAPLGLSTLGLWDVASCRELLRIRSPGKRAIRGGVFSPDGRSLALDLGDDLLSLWEVATGKERRRYDTRPRPDRGQSEAGQDGGLSGGGFGGPTLLFVRPAPGIAVSPDGRLLAQAGPGGVVRLWEQATGKVVGLFRGHRGPVVALAFAPDGQTLASGSSDTTALVWDVAALTRGRKPPIRTLPRRDLEAHWADLAGDDAARAYHALGALAGAPRQAAPFLRDRLRPAAPADVEKIRRLIGDLDRSRFAARQKAGRELKQVGESALPLMQNALAQGPSLETRRRLEGLIASLSVRAPTGGALRELRAVEALERMGTPGAVAVLKGLAKGAAGARLTDAARAALQRLRG